MKTIKLFMALSSLLISACGSGSEGSAATQAYWDQHMAYFAANPAPVGATMMIGDSITERWTQQLGFPISWVNRGISGDTTAGVIKRLATHLAERPAKVYLLIGINDCQKDPNTVINNYPAMLQIAAMYPSTQFNVVSILPIYGYGVSNATVELVNARIKSDCQRFGVNYIDAYTPFYTYSDPISLFSDNIHPSDLGYTILYPLLR